MCPSPFFIYPCFSDKNNVNPPVFTPFQERMCALVLPCYVLVSYAEALRIGASPALVVRPGTSLTLPVASVRLDQSDLGSSLQHHRPEPPRFLGWRDLWWLLQLSSRLASSRHSIPSSSRLFQPHLYPSLPPQPSSSRSVDHSPLPQQPPSSFSVLLRCERTQLCWQRSSFPSCVPCRYSCSR